MLNFWWLLPRHVYTCAEICLEDGCLWFITRGSPQRASQRGQVLEHRVSWKSDKEVSVNLRKTDLKGNSLICLSTSHNLLHSSATVWGSGGGACMRTVNNFCTWSRWMSLSLFYLQRRGVPGHGAVMCREMKGACVRQCAVEPRAGGERWV